MDELAYKGMLYDINNAVKKKTDELKRQMSFIHAAADLQWGDDGFDIYNSALALKGLKQAVDKARILHEEILSLLEQASVIKTKIGGR